MAALVNEVINLHVPLHVGDIRVVEQLLASQKELRSIESVGHSFLHSFIHKLIHSF